MKRDADETAPALAVADIGVADIGVADIGVAATVVLVRDSAHGPEVLLLERPHHRGSFAGAWVFPGGGVDPEDRLVGDSAARLAVACRAAGDASDSANAAELAEQRAARRAAVREVREETALEVPPDSLVATARWTPPHHAAKRMRTWFYLAPAPVGQISLPADELLDFAWLRPAVALERHASGSLTLVAPTWVTLNGLTQHASVDAILEHARQSALEKYATRLGTNEGAPVLVWEEDVAYADDALFAADGDRHRLEIGRLPWVYSRSDLNGQLSEVWTVPHP